MPFHTWCFEAFIRLSRKRLGRIDVNGLMDWRAYQHNAHRQSRQPGQSAWQATERDAFECIPRDSNVRKDQEQWWHHRNGNEYLGANAVLVPELPGILDAATTPVDGSDSVFDLTQQDVEPRNPDNHDPFRHLSLELCLEVLEYLDGQSIASLRLASRAFRQLPQSSFYRLIRRELPYLWEAAQDIEGDPSPYFWRFYTSRDLSKYIEDPERPEQKDYHDEIDLYRRVIKQEMPELYDDWVDAEPSIRQILGGPSWPPPVREEERLRKGNANWFRVYVDITNGLRKGNLKGLKNRQRVWSDVNFIIDKIIEAREAGHMA